LLSFDGNVKLSDFGIAKTADEIKDSIPQKVITGKYPYNVARADLRAIGHRSQNRYFFRCRFVL
jgi:serine/threonine protein kinase